MGGSIRNKGGLQPPEHPPPPFLCHCISFLLISLKQPAEMHWPPKEVVVVRQCLHKPGTECHRSHSSGLKYWWLFCP